MTKTFTYYENGKKWKLPEVVYFYTTTNTPYFYNVVEFRCPKKGEYYLSGALVTGYLAPNDLSTEFLVVELTKKAVQQTIWVASLD